ncbi:hypothetical protein OF897_20750 [Chryseobacterium formosus]|uniref:Uncharacterized protein n=1 Tax=Chryseobacterium formosus TaxID=1537363 RepID=A0ABT3XXH0_9FLAO|nr:hypothetical protein [Chryseobacterium formosus]MCX8526350.1 hypothetical protein [Chryseobacterium formosus]
MYQPIVKLNIPIDRANLNGLYKTFTPLICTSLNFDLININAAIDRHSSPK